MRATVISLILLSAVVYFPLPMCLADETPKAPIPSPLEALARSLDMPAVATALAGSDQEAIKLVAEGELLERQGRDDEAFVRYEAAAKLGLSPKTQARLMCAVGNMLANEEIGGLAEQTLAKALALAQSGDTKAQILVGQAGLLSSRKRFPEANAKLQEAFTLAQSPKFRGMVTVVRSSVLMGMGQAARAREEFARAESFFREAVGATADANEKADLAGLVATIYMSEKRWDHALGELRKSVDLPISPDRKARNLGLQGGILLHGLKRPAEAKAVLEQALSVAPDGDLRSLALVGIGEVAAAQGSTRKALLSYEQAFRAATGKEARPYALFKMGIAQVRSGQSRQGLDTFEKVIQMTKNPTRKARSLANIGYILLQEGKKQEAREKLRQALATTERRSVRAHIQKLLEQAR